MGSYLNLDMGFPTHPKTIRLTGLLGRGAEVTLIRLWCYCGMYHRGNGELTGYSELEVESIVGWWGKTGEYIPALLKCRWLEPLPEGGWKCHDWVEHQGHLEALHLRAKHAANSRWARLKGGGAPEDAPSNATGNAPGNAPAVPSRPTRPDLPSSEGEARARLEGKTQKSRAVALPASSRSDEEFMAGLRENPAYRDIDVDREHQKMCVWCEIARKSPSRRRFVNWLNRADVPLKSKGKDHSEHIDIPLL